MQTAGQPWAVSSLAQAAGVAALKETAYVDEVRALIARQRPVLTAGLGRWACRVIDGKANYLLFRAPADLNERLRPLGTQVRSCANYPGLGPEWYRTAVRTVPRERPAAGTYERGAGMSRAKCIMVQGTMSGAGKSLLCAALCRIFAQDSLRAVPFKSQNMALNSFVTQRRPRDGPGAGGAGAGRRCRAGRADEPHPLKPSSDVGSQVIVNGEVRGQMKASEYFRTKRQLVPDILKAYDSLAEEADVIVIEGAGSPAEINLKSEDIVNMGLAEMWTRRYFWWATSTGAACSPSYTARWSCWKKNERRRIKGLVINKFRGDVEILRPGLAMLEEKTHLPVVGVVPYLKVDIEDEDSLSQRLEMRDGKKAAGCGDHPSAASVQFYGLHAAGTAPAAGCAVCFERS